MLSLNNDFIGYHPQVRNVLFSGSDTNEVFLENIKVQPKDWYYRTNEISYIRNNYGHRCKNIEDIDLNNYILFLGCSHTEGIGLKLEDTHPYLLSQKMNCDYYNLGVGATGVDILNYNFVTWFAKIKRPPKVVIVQWPPAVRVTLQNFPKSKDITPEPFHQHGVWSKQFYKELGPFFTIGEHINYFNTLCTLTKKIIHNIATCPIIEVNTSHDPNPNVDVKLVQIDYARDFKFFEKKHGYGHMGVESEKINAELIYQKIKNASIE